MGGEEGGRDREREGQRGGETYQDQCLVIQEVGGELLIVAWLIYFCCSSRVLQVTFLS